MPGHHFISYAPPEAQDFALKLTDRLTAGPPSLPVWLDKRELHAGQDWDKQLVEAIRTCESLLFVMTQDSVEDESVCKDEWVRALRYKKPIVPLKLQGDAELPFRLGSRQHIDFSGAFDPALARLREHLQWLASPAGVLQALQDRLQDARRDERRAQDPAEVARIAADITELERQIAAQRQAIEHPQAVAVQVEASIVVGLERERQPARPVGGVSRSKFVNPPPAAAPTHFQDRHVETGLVGQFLGDEAIRLITVVGRGGIGKTAMVCRLLKALERGHLPDDGGPLTVDGIVYLSALSSQRLDVPMLYADLARLLPDDRAAVLETLAKDPRVTTEDQLRALLAEFPTGRTVLLLDNFEDRLDPRTLDVQDRELDAALRTVLSAPHHGVKVVLTTRVAPRALGLVEPGKQRRLDLDDGLGSPFAENILRALDADGKLGLRDAPAALLDEARERTRGYPRALEALVAILSADRGTTLREVLDDPVLRLPEQVVEVLVGEAFSRLDPIAQQVLQALAIYGRPVAAVAIDYLLQPYLASVDSSPVLGRLVSWQFARREAGRYYLHPVDRAYALGRIPAGVPEDRDMAEAPFSQYALRARAADYFEQARLPREDWKRLDDLGPQLAEFDLRCAGEDYDAAAAVLLEIDFNYLLLWGHRRMMAELHERLVGKLTDRELDARARNSLALAYQALGRQQVAITSFEQVLAIFREMGSRQNEGVALGNLGNSYQSLGQVTRAIDYYEQALAIHRESGDRRSEGNDLNNLGNSYQSLGQVTRAIDYHEQALAISRGIGDRQGEGNDLTNLGNSYQSLGQVTRAIDYQEQALAIHREVGDRQGEGAALGNLGNSYQRLGQVTRAIDYYEQGLAIVRETGDRRSERAALGNLGNSYQRLGQVTRAIDYQEQALAISREIGDRQGEGNDLTNLGCCYQDLGQVARALDYCEQALAIFQEIGSRLNEGIVLLNLAELASSTGRISAAVEHVQAGLQIAQQLSNTWVDRLAHATAAEISLLAGDLPAARAVATRGCQDAVPELHHRLLVLLGIIALRQDDQAVAHQAFVDTVTRAEAWLSTATEDYQALETKGLALAGLTLCGHDRQADAITSFQAARALNSSTGVVGAVLRRLDALALGSPAGVLERVRTAAAGTAL